MNFNSTLKEQNFLTSVSKTSETVYLSVFISWFVSSEDWIDTTFLWCGEK